MSENKFFKIIKTTPNQVMFILHSISNPSLSKLIRLTDRIPEQTVPADWALDLFLNEEIWTKLNNSCALVFINSKKEYLEKLNETKPLTEKNDVALLVYEEIGSQLSKMCNIEVVYNGKDIKKIINKLKKELAKFNGA